MCSPAVTTSQVAGSSRSVMLARGDARLGGRLVVVLRSVVGVTVCGRRGCRGRRERRGRVPGLQVTHDEQRPARGDPRREPVVEVELRHRRVGVVRRDQVEGPRGFPRAEVGSHPLDPVVDSLGGGPLGRSRQRLGGDVDRRHLPPGPAEPDRLGALTAARLQGGPGPQPADLVHQVRVRRELVPGSRTGSALLVVLVPVGLVELVARGLAVGWVEHLGVRHGIRGDRAVDVREPFSRHRVHDVPLQWCRSAAPGRPSATAGRRGTRRSSGSARRGPARAWSSG